MPDMRSAEGIVQEDGLVYPEGAEEREHRLLCAVSHKGCEHRLLLLPRLQGVRTSASFVPSPPEGEGWGEGGGLGPVTILVGRPVA